jgi:hypothetical protein
MADRKGDPAKQPDACKENGISRCSNMKETGGGFEGEQYRCEVCGAAYYLDYDEMREH